MVAGIGRHLPYTVPDGYFDTLPVQMMLGIAIEEKAGEEPVLNINNQHGYEVPIGYFEGLASSILNRIKAGETPNAQEELALLSPVLGGIVKKNPFASPDNYFANIPENIIAGLSAVDFVNEELENLPAGIAGLRTKPVYEVPDGYFDAMPGVLLAKAKQQGPAKIFNIGVSSKIARYAAAAIATGIVVLSVLLYPGKKPVAVTDIAKATATIPDGEIEKFLNNNTVSLADTYADTISPMTPDEPGVNADDTKDLLADISDEELQKYVDRHNDTPITN